MSSTPVRMKIARNKIVTKIAIARQNIQDGKNAPNKENDGPDTALRSPLDNA